MKIRPSKAFWSLFDSLSFQKPGPFGVWMCAGAVRVVADAKVVW